MLEIPPMATWVTDLQHLVPEFVKDAPAPAKRRAAFTREVVEAATCRTWREPWISAVPCVARVGRRLCRGRIRIVISTLESVEWCCTDCPENGVITGHVETPSDLSAYAPKGKLVFWGIDDAERDFLREHTAEMFELRSIISRARPHVDVPGLLLQGCSKFRFGCTPLFVVWALCHLVRVSVARVGRTMRFGSPRLNRRA